MTIFICRIQKNSFDQGITMKVENVVEEAVDDNESHGAEIFIDADEDETDDMEEMPNRGDIVRLVSKHMRTVFRQLTDINQRLQHLEDKVLNIWCMFVLFSFIYKWLGIFYKTKKNWEKALNSYDVVCAFEFDIRDLT